MSGSFSIWPRNLCWHSETTQHTDSQDNLAGGFLIGLCLPIHRGFVSENLLTLCSPSPLNHHPSSAMSTTARRRLMRDFKVKISNSRLLSYISSRNSGFCYILITTQGC